MCVHRWSALLVSAVVVLSCVANAQQQPQQHQRQTCDQAIPANVEAGLLAPEMRALLRRSDTFRAQCDRLAAEPRVRVKLELVSLLDSGRAQTTLRRYASGAIHADVQVLFGEDYRELLAHEFEHILEQIDRVNLGGASDGPGITRLEDGSFETARARRAGTIVAMEMEAAATTPASFPPPQTSITPVRDR
jgi:hypothetical protein